MKKVRRALAMKADKESDPLREQLRAIIAEVAELEDAEQVRDDADLFADLGLDSMQTLEIVLEIEQQLGLSVPADRLRGLRSLGDAVALARDLGPGEVEKS